MGDSACQLDLPGFRFHPTEEELLSYYLKSMIGGKRAGAGDVIGILNIYKYDPKELPGLARIGEREWYFFVPRDRKHGSGGRPNRTTENGFWKATGSDRKIVSSADPKKVLGLRKTLVFYQGRAPRGKRTDWVMKEYRLPDSRCPHPKVNPEDLVLCKIYMKATPLKALEQWAAMEEKLKPTESTPSSNHLEEVSTHGKYTPPEEDQYLRSSSKARCGPSLVLPNGLDELQLPKCSMDWSHDPFWAQLSPFLENLTPSLPMC